MTGANKPMRSFRESPWRYSQFVVLGLIAAGLLKWISSFGWLPALVVGALICIGYLLLEQRRGVI